MFFLSRIPSPTSIRCAWRTPICLVVSQQVGQFAPLLHQADAGQPGGLLLEPGNCEQLAQHDAGIVKAQRSVKVACQQIGPCRMGFLFHASFPHKDRRQVAEATEVPANGAVSTGVCRLANRRASFSAAVSTVSAAHRQLS
jgi:hypothetical protein